jgi:hypothetical protein
MCHGMLKPMPFRQDDSPYTEKGPENSIDPSQRVTYSICSVGVPLTTKSLHARFNPLVVGFGIVSPFMHVPNANDQPILNRQAAETPSRKNLNLEGRR